MSDNQNDSLLQGFLGLQSKHTVHIQLPSPEESLSRKHHDETHLKRSIL